MLVDIVIAAMARLPALAHEPSRNFAPIRLESWLRYGRATSLCANICASPALMSRVNIDLLPVALRPWRAHPGGWRIHLNTRKFHRAERIKLSAVPFTKRAGLQLSSLANAAPAPSVAKKAQDWKIPVYPLSRLATY
jgi:hypothetical protein